MADHTSAGDPRRSMELLWGADPGTRRGPKPGLSVEAIVAAAVELADREGLGAVSMRRVAEQLGKSAMALYTYVPGKAELLDLMLDTTLGELPTDLDPTDGWRAAVEASARHTWDLYHRHPWILQVSGSRAVLGPHEFDGYELQVRLVDGLGLSGVEMARVANVIGQFVAGSAKAVSDARTAEQTTGVSDEDWWAARSPLLDELAGDQWDVRYPTLTRLDAEQAFDQVDRPDETTPYLVQDALDTFEFGLQRLLDGIEAFVASKSAPPPAVNGT